VQLLDENWLTGLTTSEEAEPFAVALDGRGGTTGISHICAGLSPQKHAQALIRLVFAISTICPDLINPIFLTLLG